MFNVILEERIKSADRETCEAWIKVLRSPDSRLSLVKSNRAYWIKEFRKRLLALKIERTSGQT